MKRGWVYLPLYYWMERLLQWNGMAAPVPPRRGPGRLYLALTMTASHLFVSSRGVTKINKDSSCAVGSIGAKKKVSFREGFSSGLKYMCVHGLDHNCPQTIIIWTPGKGFVTMTQPLAHKLGMRRDVRDKFQKFFLITSCHEAVWHLIRTRTWTKQTHYCSAVFTLNSSHSNELYLLGYMYVSNFFWYSSERFKYSILFKKMFILF